MSGVRVRKVKVTSLSRGIEHFVSPPDEMPQAEADVVEARATQLQGTAPVTVDDGRVVAVTGKPELLASAENDKASYDAAIRARLGEVASPVSA